MKTKITILWSLFITMFASGTLFAQTFLVDGINYNVTSSTTVEVGDNAFYTGDAVIPTIVSNGGNAFAVTSVGSSAFESCHGLTSVTIPNTVTSIAPLAFLKCRGLISVSIPNSVQSIGEAAFSDCIGLTFVTIPDSVASIGNNAFERCTSLTSITMPNSITSIPNAAFNACTSLTSIDIPNTVTSIGDNAFSACYLVSSLTIPNSVTSIGILAFGDCYSLTSVTVNWTNPLSINRNVFDGLNLLNTILNVPAGTAWTYANAPVWNEFGSILQPIVVPVFGQTFTENGINYIVTKETLPYEVAVGSNSSFVGAATIPATVLNAGNSFDVTGIDVEAFYGCVGLTAVSIPNSVTSIGDGAFSSCSSLTDITVEWQTPLAIDDSVFDFVPIETVVLHVPDGTAALYADAPVWQDFFKSKPEVESPQQFCGSATLSEVIVQGSPAATELKWYDADGNYLESYSQIYSSATYYVSQVVNGIESLRAAVDVNLTVTDTPTVYDYATPICSFPITLQSYPNVTGSNLRWYDAAGNELDPTTSIDLNTASSNFYFVSQTIDDCESDKIQVSFLFPNPFISTVETTQYFKPADALAMNLLPNDNQWFREANDNNLISSFDALTDNTYYFVKEYNDVLSDYCSYFTPVLVVIVPAPTADAQTFSGTATVADLIVTATGTIKWYNADGVILENNFPLSTGKYYVTQTIGNLESDTTEVEVTISSLYTAIPDPDFEQALFDLGIDNINGDKQVLTSAISIIKSLDISAHGISNLKGIEGFTSLLKLYCYDNYLTTLDLNGLTALQMLGCSGNQITRLNLNGLSALQTLYCNNNQLTSLDLNGLTALQNLNCQGNELTSLDLNGLTSLYSLLCSNNQMTSLNLSGLTSLQSLFCNNNQMTNLDLNGLSTLQYVDCESNALTSLNLKGVNELQTLLCNTNQMTSLDLDGLSTLRSVDCKSNALTSLNLNGLTELQFLDCEANQLKNLDLSELPFLSYLNCSSNIDLTCITVSDPTAASGNDQWIKDDTTSYATNCNLQQYTAIPDADFEQALFDRGIDTINGDKQVLTSAIIDITILDISNKNISDLTGIAGFTSLQTLYCSDNQLTNLDLSSLTTLQDLDCSNNGQMTSLNLRGLTALQTLICFGNQLTSLDLNGLTALKVLDCKGNGLTSLDLTGLTDLQFLYCQDNALPSIDLSGLTALQNLWCSANQLTSLDLSALTSLNYLDCSSNIDLTCITVLDPTAAAANSSWFKDDTANYSTNCNLQEYTEIRSSGFEQALFDQGIDTVNGDFKVLTSAISRVTSLNLQDRNIGDLTGIEGFTSLTYLDCSRNALSSLNISANTALKTLICSQNGLSSLNITANTDLEGLGCDFNQLTSLNISANKALKGLSCSYNSLSSLNINNNTALNNLFCAGNSLTNLDVSANKALSELYCNSNLLTTLDLSTNLALEYLKCFDNSSLSCITVPDPVTAAANLNWLKDAKASYAANCNLQQYTAIPDANFEQALFDLGIDTVNGDKQVLTSDIVGQTYLDISNKNISDLTGIEGFTALQALYCQQNQLSSLNISSNTALQLLVCKQNQLTSLNISTNSALEGLACDLNQLTSLNISANKALKALSCNINSISSLNISNNTALTFLDCGGNSLTSLNVNANKALNELACHSNSLTSLDLSANTDLEYLKCFNNSSLSCITVPNPVVAAANLNWLKDAKANYSANCDVVSTGSTAAILSGSTAICSGNSATISVAITRGKSPYTVVYSNGISNDTITGYVSGSVITVSPTTSTTYSLISVTDAAANLGTGNSGTALITVNPKVTPTFTVIASICIGASLSALPTTSTNGISGTWSPALNNLTTTTYTFTPSVGQCADSASLTIAVNKVEPPIAEAQVVCSSSNIASLKAIGSNLLWYYNDYDTSPLNSTDSVYDTTYYVSQTVNGCESPRTVVQVTVESAPEIYPVYDVYPCSSYSLPYLSVGNYYTGPSGSGIMVPQGSLITTSQTLYVYAANNCGVSEQYFYISIHRPAQVDYLSDVTTCGSYTLPALSYGDYYTESYAGGNALYPGNVITSSQTVYIFNYGNCGNAESSFYINIENPEPPLATAQSFCDGATIANLTATGTAIQWYATAEGGSPLSGSDLLTTNTYFATQTLNDCESKNRTAVVVSINALITPTFTAIAPICSGETLAALPTISNNGILGTWSPALNNLATTTYTFTPSAGQCADTTTLSITVKPKITPTFTAVAAICSGATLAALPTISNNGILGTWSPALNNLATTTYTFTPSAGQCADTTNLNIAVTPQPARPRLVCYQTATFNSSSCSWDVTGTMPTQPTTACYETAIFNTTTCTWNVTGTQPTEPTLACYETATFNAITCAWVVSGTQPTKPTLACYETATFNTATCAWVKSGTQPAMPILACHETATFDTTTCAWVKSGTQPVQPALACFETATFDTTTCAWVKSGTQPVQPTLACYETATFNTSTCAWVKSGTQPVQPARLNCWETFTFNDTTCTWVKSGTQPVQPARLNCWDTFTFNGTTCTWTKTGTQPLEPALACYETAIFNTTTCAWDVKGTAPAAPTGNATQTFVSGTLNNIVLSGSGIKWYASGLDASTRTNVLPITTVLVDKTTYYATQTINGCESASGKAVTVTVTLSVNNFDSKAFAYYPNPVTNELNLSYFYGLTSVRVTDILGRQLYFKKLNENAVKVDMSGMVRGVYFVEVTSDNSSKTIKVVKE